MIWQSHDNPFIADVQASELRKHVISRAESWRRLVAFSAKVSRASPPPKFIARYIPRAATFWYGHWPWVIPDAGLVEKFVTSPDPVIDFPEDNWQFVGNYTWWLSGWDRDEAKAIFMQWAADERAKRARAETRPHAT